MIARILAIGDELTLGRTVDTNSAHVARWLTDQGFTVDLVQTVGDGMEAIVGALQRAIDGASLVVCTGGLGPTDDDRTRHAVAAVCGVPLVEHAASWTTIVAWFRRSRPGVSVPPSNRRQALLPRGARPIANDRGTAPGILARAGSAKTGTLIACVPGVPYEMEGMIALLTRRLPRLFPALVPPTIAEVCFAGIGESTAQGLIGKLFTEHAPQVGITVSELGHITLRVIGRPTEVKRRARELARALAPYVLPARSLPESLVHELRRRRWRIAAAESCTCGHIAALIGSVPGASAVMHESLVAYHEDVKRRRLGVLSDTLVSHGVVSEACAIAMATGAIRLTGSDIAIATTGFAGPDGGTRKDPVGTVWIAVADPRGTEARRISIRGSRERVQRRAAAQALQLAWSRISQ